MIRARTAAFGPLVLALGLFAGCPHRVSTPVGPAVVPGPRLGPEPTPPSDLAGRAWLDSVHAKLHDRWAETFLEQSRLYLPPAHPLNNASLEALLRLTIDKDGTLRFVEVTRSSGNTDFDGAAKEIVTASAPFAAPPDELLSDDGNVYVAWRFARDARQDGLAGVKVERQLYPADRAVPELLHAGRIADAAERVIAEATPEGAAHALELARAVAGGVLEVALADERDPAARIDAANAAGDAKWGASVPALRRVASVAADPGLRAAATRALGELDDQESWPLFTEAVNLLDDRSAVAAAALVRAGKGHDVWTALEKRLHDPDGHVRALALDALAEVGDPASVPALIAILDDKGAARIERSAAALALGAAATDAAAPAARKLVATLAEGDAAIRLAAVQGLGHAVTRGLRARALFFSVLPLLGDKDPRVRAAAVVVAAGLSGKDALGEITNVATRTKDGALLVACARAFGMIDQPEAVGPLVRLAASPSADVREAALRVLARRPESEARKVVDKFAGDADPRLRALAIASQDDPASARAALEDPAPEVRAEALVTFLRRASPVEGVPVGLRALVGASGRERVLLARALLLATGDKHAR